ncbi:MAG: polysaccharide biosynthesis protein [Coleofasciculus sp. G1-WW12-02]|uniref:polysaccharide biosynthesis protein n=1 Tax=Coleofasciculus sp. G1-WW12-02 TaxID=3068483 RepID=UPI0032FEBED1
MPPTFLPSTLIRRAKILSQFVSAQLVVQALGFTSGILLVRTLEQQQYAYFTIANTMQATMNVLADMGIGSGLSVIGGKVWQDQYRFGQLINTAMQLRRYLAVIAIIVVTPILLWLLISNGISIVYATLIIVIVLVEFNFRLTTGVLVVVPRLHSQINRLQSLELIFAASRLCMLSFAYLTYLNAAVALIASTVASGLQRLLIGYWVTDNVNNKASVQPKDREEILKLVKSQAPYFIFYCIQGQFTIWLISILGNTQSIAEVGALGRLGVLLAVIGSVMSSIIAPSFARCQSVNQLRFRYFQTIGLFIFFSLFLIGFAALFPRELLWILGEKYAHLESELVFMAGNSMIKSLASIMISLNSSKGWIKNSWIIVPSTIVTQFITITLVQVSTVKKIFIFEILSMLPTIFINAFMTYRGLYEDKKSD